jgi:hypothetical protein
MRSALIVPFGCSPRSEQHRGKERVLKIVLFGLGVWAMFSQNA